MTEVVMKLVGLTTGDETRFDGKYVVAYHPERGRWRGASSVEEIEEMIAEFVEVTDDPKLALVFPSITEAHAFWTQEGVGVRPADGKNHRPLTAFSVEMTRRDA